LVSSYSRGGEIHIMNSPKRDTRDTLDHYGTIGKYAIIILNVVIIVAVPNNVIRIHLIINDEQRRNLHTSKAGPLILN